MEAARAFYADVLGWDARDASMPGFAYQLLTAEDTPVAGLLSLPDEARRAGVAPHWIGYVGVDDVDIAAVRVKTLAERSMSRPRMSPISAAFLSLPIRRGQRSPYSSG